MAQQYRGDKSLQIRVKAINYIKILQHYDWSELELSTAHRVIPTGETK